MVTTVSWRKGVNLWSFACHHRGVLTEDFERTRAILRGHDEGCLLMLDLIFSVGSIGFRMRARCDRFSGACETDQRKAKARHNRWDAKLRSYATRSAVMPRSPISISATPVSPIRGASRQNWSSFCDRRFIGPCRKKESARLLISPVQESLSCKRSKYLCSDRPSKLPTNGSVNR